MKIVLWIMFILCIVGVYAFLRIVFLWKSYGILTPDMPYCTTSSVKKKILPYNVETRPTDELMFIR